VALLAVKETNCRLDERTDFSVLSRKLRYVFFPGDSTMGVRVNIRLPVTNMNNTYSFSIFFFYFFHRTFIYRHVLQKYSNDVGRSLLMKNIALGHCWIKLLLVMCSCSIIFVSQFWILSLFMYSVWNASQQYMSLYETNRLMLSICLWRWYINMPITILDIIHLPTNVS
jgi:hypothetical protein